MKDLISTRREKFNYYFEKQKWQFCFIGGIALLFWGEQRIDKRC